MKLFGYIDSVAIDGIFALIHAVCGNAACPIPVFVSPGTRFCNGHDHFYGICHVMAIPIVSSRKIKSLGSCNSAGVRCHVACKQHRINTKVFVE